MKTFVELCMPMGREAEALKSKKSNYAFRKGQRKE